MNYSVKKNEIVVGNFKLENPKSIWIFEFVSLRSKMYSFNCGDDIENKLEGISKSQLKHKKFEQYENCFNGEEYQKECDTFIIRSLDHETYFQLGQKSTISLFDAKPCYIINIESEPWN